MVKSYERMKLVIINNNIIKQTENYKFLIVSHVKIANTI
jgi:hypothetical protein